jgi:hypothetical protein
MLNVNQFLRNSVIKTFSINKHDDSLFDFAWLIELINIILSPN